MGNRNLTICLIATAESIHTLKWAKYFSEKGHKVHLVSYAPLLGGYDLGDIELHFLKKEIPTEIWPFNTLLNLPFNLLRTKKIINKIKPDIVHSHYVTSYGTLSSLLGFHPLVITAWGSDILVTPKKFLPSKWTIKYALSKADLITCDAEHMKQALINLGVKESKIMIINFGIDTKKFSPGVKDEKLKNYLEAPANKIIISLRSLEPIYSLETLLQAVPLVIKNIPKTKFVVVGKGSQEKELKRLAEDLGIKDNIMFVGHIPNDELPNYLRIADIYVSTSLSDGGIAASTAEAMSCGLPVVITDSGDNKEWVGDKKNGFLIPLKNPDILAEKIIYLLRNENISKKFGEENRKIIKERNDYYQEMAKMEEIYRELLKVN